MEKRFTKLAGRLLGGMSEEVECRLRLGGCTNQAIEDLSKLSSLGFVDLERLSNSIPVMRESALSKQAKAGILGGLKNFFTGRAGKMYKGIGTDLTKSVGKMSEQEAHITGVLTDITQKLTQVNGKLPRNTITRLEGMRNEYQSVLKNLQTTREGVLRNPGASVGNIHGSLSKSNAVLRDSSGRLNNIMSKNQDVLKEFGFLNQPYSRNIGKIRTQAMDPIKTFGEAGPSSNLLTGAPTVNATANATNNPAAKAVAGNWWDPAKEFTMAHPLIAGGAVGGVAFGGGAIIGDMTSSPDLRPYIAPVLGALTGAGVAKSMDVNPLLGAVGGGGAGYALNRYI